MKLIAKLGPQRYLWTVFRRLLLLRSAGNHVHRDILFVNILIDNNHEAFLIDFGFALPINHEPSSFKGSFYTASQRVLRYISLGHSSFVYRPDDDLESFLKMVLLRGDLLKLPELQPISTTVRQAKIYWDFWDQQASAKSKHMTRKSYLHIRISQFLEFLDFTT